jgi:hypothetical protein
MNDVALHFAVITRTGSKIERNQFRIQIAHVRRGQGVALEDFAAIPGQFDA